MTHLRRYSFALLVLAALLSGCSTGSAPATTPAPAETSTTSTAYPAEQSQSTAYPAEQTESTAYPAPTAGS